MYSIPSGSVWLQAGFIILAEVVVLAIAYMTRSKRTLLLGHGWLVLTAGLGLSGVLAHFDTLPPRPVLLFVPTLVAVFLLARGAFGATLSSISLRWLVGFQAFRIVVEVLIHRAVTEGIAPPQMTWTGLNLDILTGALALALCPFADRLPRAALVGFNVLGLALLAWVVGVAVVSMPGPLQRLEPDNVWVAYFPWVWLPTIMVAAALLMHLALFRRLFGAQDTR